MSASAEVPPEAWQGLQASMGMLLRHAMHGDGPAGISAAFIAAVDGVCKAGGAQAMLLAVQEMLERIELELTQVLLPAFSANLEHCSTLGDSQFAIAFPAALRQLCAPLESARKLVAATTEHILHTVEVTNRAHRVKLDTSELQLQYATAARVLSATSEALLVQLSHFFVVILAAMRAAEQNAEGEASGLLGIDEEFGVSEASALREVSAHMSLLDLSAVLKRAVVAAVRQHIQACVDGCAAGVFDESVLGPMLEYSCTVPLSFLQLVLPPPPKEQAQATMQGWRSELESLVYTTVGGLRIREMFEIVVDYPDSQPALQDLRGCLRHAAMHRDLVTRFGQAVRERLLHPGAATADILQHYVSTIRALQLVDRSGAVLDAVSGPIREYLRSRKDTTRCIVTMLTDDSAEATTASLFADADGGAGDADMLFFGPDADRQALLEAERWEPDPIETDPALRNRGGSDAISLLVGIYGSRELFMSEYRSMLADRLLAKPDYDCDRDLRTLELLKLRFGEGSLAAAEVMLRDLAESKRVNANVKSVPDTATPLKKRRGLVAIDALSATIISQFFWPPLPQEEFALPPQVRSMLETYALKYHSLKAPRVLEWKHSLGTVTLDLAIGDRRLEFHVSPFHATVLLHFQQRAEWTQAELAQALGAPPEALRRRAVYWVNQGVLSERRDANGAVCYVRNEQLQTHGGPGLGEGESGMDIEDGGGGDPERTEMARLEPFILGMLTNFDSLPLDRIHNMLKMFATDPPYDKTLEQLSTYMSLLASEDKVALEGGVYKRRG